MSNKAFNVPSLLADSSIIKGVVVFTDNLRPPEPRCSLLNQLVGLRVRDELVEDNDPRLEADNLNLSRTISRSNELNMCRYLSVIHKLLSFPMCGN
jgi:hypothetical protein